MCAKNPAKDGGKRQKGVRIMRAMYSSLLVLDIDGVLNTPSSQSAGGMTNFSTSTVLAMHRLLEEANFEVLLCSSWRVDQNELLAQVLQEHGLGEITRRLKDQTPVFDAMERVSRGQEIDAWLYRSGYCGRLAILDDEDPLPELRDWWLPVDQEHGLTMELASAAAQLLRSGPIYIAAN